MRSRNSFLTMLTGITSMLVIGILGFLKIKFFISGLGDDANGLIQMITRILSYLSLAELGLGSALIYRLYKPLAENDKEQVSIIMNTANHFFIKIGFFILGLLFALMFLIPIIIKNNSYDNFYLYKIFILIGIPYVIEYLWYKKYYILLCSDQKQYIVNLVINGCTIIYDIIVIIALINGISLTTFVLLNYPFIIIKGIGLQMVCKKRYSYIKKTNKIDKNSVELSKDVFVHNLGYSINNSSDQIVLSIFNGLSFVSIYSSYYYIVKYLKDAVDAILKSTTHSFGNLFAQKEDRNKKGYSVYKEYLSFSSVFAIIITTTFFVSIIPFINIWIGKSEYILSFPAILAFTCLVFANIITIPISIMATSNGVFKQTKYYSFLATIVNILLSILLIKKYEIAGIVFATVFSKLFIWAPLTIKVLYRDVFFEHSKKDFYFRTLISTICVAIIICLSLLLKVGTLYTNSFTNWVLISLVFFVIIALLICCAYFIFDESFKQFVKRCIKVFSRRKK